MKGVVLTSPAVLALVNRMLKPSARVLEEVEYRLIKLCSKFKVDISPSFKNGHTSVMRTKTCPVTSRVEYSIVWRFDRRFGGDLRDLLKDLVKSRHLP
jgi:hypothetical protein